MCWQHIAFRRCPDTDAAAVKSGPRFGNGIKSLNCERCRFVHPLGTKDNLLTIPPFFHSLVDETIRRRSQPFPNPTPREGSLV